MRQAPNSRIEPYRIRSGPLASATTDGNNGAFLFPMRVKYNNQSTKDQVLIVIVSDTDGWDHISVSLLGSTGPAVPILKNQRCPTWEEMCFIKDLFFEETETVVQYHPPIDKHVNCHPYCLHLWRKHNYEYPLPDESMISTTLEPPPFHPPPQSEGE